MTDCHLSSSSVDIEKSMTKKASISAEMSAKVMSQTREVFSGLFPGKDCRLTGRPLS
jgi:hypothetical protein